jgi:N6-L-threonylcarbamoyladenine synthase
VGANQRLRARLRRLGDETGARVYFPRPEFCTDNGAMIALAGCLRMQAGARPAPGPGVRAVWELADDVT